MLLNKHCILMTDYMLTQHMAMLANFTINYLRATGRLQEQRPALKPHIIFLEGVRDELLQAQILEFRRG